MEENCMDCRFSSKRIVDYPCSDCMYAKDSWTYFEKGEGDAEVSSGLRGEGWTDTN